MSILLVKEWGFGEIDLRDLPKATKLVKWLRVLAANPGLCPLGCRDSGVQSYRIPLTAW